MIEPTEGAVVALLAMKKDAIRSRALLARDSPHALRHDPRLVTEALTDQIARPRDSEIGHGHRPLPRIAFEDHGFDVDQRQARGTRSGSRKAPVFAFETVLDPPARQHDRVFSALPVHAIVYAAFFF